MRKKVWAAFAATAVFTGAVSFSAMAESASWTELPSESTIDVKAKYEDKSMTDSVYKVDVTWGSMEFTYHEAGSRIWDPETHAYTLKASGTWQASGNAVTVTNHSNVGIQAGFSFAPAAEFTDLGWSFTNPGLTLASAEGTAVENAPSGITELNLSGELDAAVTDFRTVGRITVTIAEQK